MELDTVQRLGPVSQTHDALCVVRARPRHDLELDRDTSGPRTCPCASDNQAVELHGAKGRRDALEQIAAAVLNLGDLTVAGGRRLDHRSAKRGRDSLVAQAEAKDGQTVPKLADESGRPREVRRLVRRARTRPQHDARYMRQDRAHKLVPAHRELAAFSMRRTHHVRLSTFTTTTRCSQRGSQPCCEASCENSTSRLRVYES